MNFNKSIKYITPCKYAFKKEIIHYFDDCSTNERIEVLDKCRAKVIRNISSR